MKIADSHCHLTMESFDADRGQVLERAAREGVTLFVTIPARKGDAPVCRALAVADERIYATAGLHPHEARLWDGDAAADLRAAARSPRVVAVGEIGLDFHYDLSPRDVQQCVFREPLPIAREASLPVVVHSRAARSETITVLREENVRETGGVLHCFTEDAAAAREILDLGFYISFSGIVTFPKAQELQEAARIVPADRILVETDAPFLAPIPYRGRRNEPSFLPATIRLLSQLRREDPAGLAERTFDNCRRAFRLDGR